MSALSYPHAAFLALCSALSCYFGLSTLGLPDWKALHRTFSAGAAQLSSRISFLRARSIEEKRTSCLQELPQLYDLMSLGLQAGLSADASLNLYAERYSSELAKQIEQVLLKTHLGLMPRSAALLELADELDLPAFSRFVALLEESQYFGTPLSDSLEMQSDLIREESRLQTEEQIEKLPVKMLIPLGTLIVPAMLIAIMGPLFAGALASM